MKPASLLAFGAVTILAGCPAPDATQGTDPANAANQPDQIMVDVKTTLTDSLGARKGYVLADTALSFDEAQRVEFRKVRITFFGDQNQQLGVLSARQATYRIAIGTVEARGDATVLLNGGARLSSPRIVFDPSRRQFRGDTTWTLESKNGNQAGTGFTANLPLTEIRKGPPGAGRDSATTR